MGLATVLMERERERVERTLLGTIFCFCFLAVLVSLHFPSSKSIWSSNFYASPAHYPLGDLEEHRPSHYPCVVTGNGGQWNWLSWAQKVVSLV